MTLDMMVAGYGLGMLALMLISLGLYAWATPERKVLTMRDYLRKDN